MAILLMGLGGLISMIGYVWFLVVSFRQSVVWGLVVLLVPFAWIVFAIKHWSTAKLPCSLLVGGLVLYIGTIASNPNMAQELKGKQASVEKQLKELDEKQAAESQRGH
ncbi:MAG: hypothetical protein C5B53_03240 [Candidatus Melainabacteria bacterium]|nr:MAG: hypothetical protein C5B53_03240 [Candidatus Melainabacteria bacterium]